VCFVVKLGCYKYWLSFLLMVCFVHGARDLCVNVCDVAFGRCLYMRYIQATMINACTTVKITFFKEVKSKKVSLSLKQADDKSV